MLCGWCTVRSGWRAAVWDHRAEVRLVDGPRRQLSREHERRMQSHAMETASTRHVLGLERMQEEERIARARLAADALRLTRSSDHDSRLRQRQELDVQHVALVVGMRDAGVEVTPCLVARRQRIDRLVRVENTGGFPLRCGTG